MPPRTRSRPFSIASGMARSPESAAPDAVVQQAATLAASLAAKPDAWPEFRAQLHRSAGKDAQIAGARRDRDRLDGEVENPLIDALLPRPAILLIAVAADLAIGDPVYPLHPSASSASCSPVLETGLRRTGADGYGGGILLFIVLAAASLARRQRDRARRREGSPATGWLAHVVLRLQLSGARRSDSPCLARRAGIWPPAISTRRARRIAALVGRDVDRMDAAACRRAAIESLSENLTDGFTSPLFWYASPDCRASRCSRS